MNFPNITRAAIVPHNISERVPKIHCFSFFSFYFFFFCLSLHKFKPATSDNDYYYKNNQSGIDPNQNSVLWNAMIYPLLNTTIYGTIWYQGESNAVYRADMYNCTFPAMINGWRKEWFSGTYRATNLSFPFGFVQVRNCISAGLREKCPYSELFWSVFSRIRTEYGKIQHISPYSVQIRENTDQNNSEYGYFLCNGNV